MPGWSPGPSLAGGIVSFANRGVRLVTNERSIVAGDWRSHAASIAQSIQLKRRMQWKKITSKLQGLSVALEKPGLWDDPVYAGRVRHEHGVIVGKMKEVNMFEQQLLEHIDMLRLAREENGEELESRHVLCLNGSVVHSAIASAHLKSFIAVDSSCWSWLSQEISSIPSSIKG